MFTLDYISKQCYSNYADKSKQKRSGRMNFNIQKAKCALIRSGKTQVQLSKELILSRPCISKAMNGGSITSNTARRIASALGVTVESLLDDGKES